MSEIWIVIGFFVCMGIGYAGAELCWRIQLRKINAKQRRDALIAEFMDRQLWQFISLDEWLEGSDES